MTSQVRRAAKSDLKALRVVRDLSEKKRHTFSLFIKICLADNNRSLFVATRVKKKTKKNKKQSLGFDRQIRYTNGNWEAAKGPSRSSSRAATRFAF